jgi:hypothetical protein
MPEFSVKVMRKLMFSAAPDTGLQRSGREELRMTEKGLRLEDDGAKLNQVIESGRRVTSESPTSVSNV